MCGLGQSRRLATFFGAGALAASVLLSAGAPVASAQYSLVQVAGNVVGNVLSRPVFLTSPAGDYRRAFIVEKQGRIRVLDITTPVPTLQSDAAPFLDIRPLVTVLAAGNPGNQDERGLLGLAFHPQYLSNGRFYVYYSSPAQGGLPNSATFYCNLVEYTNPTPLGNIANPASARFIMQIPQPQGNHNGGCLSFGPDGFLYINSGDGGASNDAGAGHNATIGNAQDTGTLLGKILRIDINVTGAPPQGAFVPGSFASYGIPSDNPTIVAPAFATGSRREIWAYGVRNPWRSSFDRLTGDLWIGEVGQNVWEEIDFQPALTPANLAQVAGRNYGWRCFEGTVSFNTNGGNCSTNFDGAANPGTTVALTGPVGMYSHGVPGAQARAFATISGTCSITGGYVSRGCRVPELYGAYLFTDYCSGRIWSTTLNGSMLANEPADLSAVIYAGSAVSIPPLPAIARPSQALVSFGEDSYGEVYVIDQPGARIFKIVRSTAGSVINSNCDINFDGGKTVQDIFDFLAAYFGGLPNSDFNRSASFSVQDIFDFLACYFSQCTGFDG